MPDMYNPDFTSPEVQSAIDAVAAQKTAEVIGYFQKTAQVAVLAALPEGSQEKFADDNLTKIANGQLPGAMLAAVMMHEVHNNKEASLADAASISALREKIAENDMGKDGKGKDAKAIFAKKKS